MDDPPITRPGCCVPKKYDEETIAMLRRDFHKYGPVMQPVPPKRYKFKRTLICSPAEMKRIEEAKRQRLAEEAEEAATGIKRPHLIAYSSHTTNVDNCDGVLLPVDLSLPLVSDVPPPSWQRYVDTYQQRRAAAVAALEARAAEVAARPPRPRFFIDPQMKLKILREHEAAEAAEAAAAAATGTEAQAECVGDGHNRPCDDSNSGTSDSSVTHAANVAL